MRAVVAAVWACTATLFVAGEASACGEQLSSPKRRIENEKYEIVLSSHPAPIETGKHFTLDIAVCPHGAAELPETVRVDAVMPEHRHGMNYRPVVVARGPGLYRAEGLMLHMAGNWELRIDVVTAAGIERHTTTIQLE